MPLSCGAGRKENERAAILSDERGVLEIDRARGHVQNHGRSRSYGCGGGHAERPAAESAVAVAAKDHDDDNDDDSVSEVANCIKGKRDNDGGGCDITLQKSQSGGVGVVNNDEVTAAWRMRAMMTESGRLLCGHGLSCFTCEEFAYSPAKRCTETRSPAAPAGSLDQVAKVETILVAQGMVEGALEVEGQTSESNIYIRILECDASDNDSDVDGVDLSAYGSVFQVAVQVYPEHLKVRLVPSTHR